MNKAEPDLQAVRYGRTDAAVGKRESIAFMGDRTESFEDIYRDYFDMVYRYIYRMVRNNAADAEDLAQEVFWVTYQKWEAVKEHPNIGGFLMLVAKNKVMKWSVSQRLLFYDEEHMLDLLAEKIDENNSYDMVDLCSAVEKTLSGEELDILMQYYAYGYSAAEMAEKLGITEGCFKVRVLRMREKIKRGIELALLFFIFCSNFIIR